MEEAPISDRFDGIVESMWGVEDALREVAAATALTWRRIHEVLTRAEAEPWEWVPAAFGATSPRLRELAVRSATADLAMRLHLGDATVRTYGSLAERLQRRLPTIWAMFSQGSVTAQHARTALEVSDPLDTESVARFDAEAAALAEALPPGRFRTRAVALAEQIRSTPMQERHDRATQRRGVWLEDAADGMAWLHALLPAASAHRRWRVSTQRPQRVERARARPAPATSSARMSRPTFSPATELLTPCVPRSSSPCRCSASSEWRSVRRRSTGSCRSTRRPRGK